MIEDNLMAVIDRYMGPISGSTEDWVKWVAWTSQPGMPVVHKTERTPSEIRKGNTMKNYTIEVRADFQKDEAKEAFLIAECKRAAKELYTKALLMHTEGARKPTIAVHTTDFFSGTHDINIDDDGDPITDEQLVEAAKEAGE